MRGDWQKLGVIIDDLKTMIHVLSNLPEKYEKIVEILEEKSDDGIDMLTIKTIWDKLSAKYDRMNAKSNQKLRKNRRRSCTCVESGEVSTTVVNIDTRSDIVQS